MNTMTIINPDDFIQSLADALQYISYYHPKDYIDALALAYEKEPSPAAKDAIAQILTNSRLSAINHRPMCQDTGIVVVFIEVGMQVQWNTEQSLEALVNQAVHLAYTNPDNILRASVVADPAGKRQNTKDNTPAVVHTRLVKGNKVTVKLAAKGGGSENKARFKILNPSQNLVAWVSETLPTLGAGWCPPGMLGIGIGGSAEKAMLLAKESLLAPINIHQLQEQGANNRIEELRLELYDKVNALGIGAQGLGGMTTVLDVKILDYPTHAASLPVALIPNCAATRHAHFSLDGSGAVSLSPPKIEDWPAITWRPDTQAKRVDLDSISQADITHWQAGERLLLTGHLLTGRDAAHKRIKQLLENKQTLPKNLNFKQRFLYYVGPVDPVKDEVVGPAGPTTATRMDSYMTMMADLGLLGTIGKAERGQQAIAVIKAKQMVYLMAVGGAAYLVSQAIKQSKVVAFADLGMEAIYEFYVEDMPVTVAVDTHGESVHQTGPAKWQTVIMT